MKMQAKCYKCGKRISVHDYATTDICPECMSFIDVAQAKAALEEEEKALSAPVTDQSEQSRKIDAPLTDIAAAAEENATESEPSPREEEWRGLWQRVLERTKGLTDLSQFESVRGDAKEAFQKMSDAERAQLYETHGKALAMRRETLVNRVKAADADVSYIESGEKQTEKKHKRLWALIPIAVVFFIVFAVFSEIFSVKNVATSIVFFLAVIVFIIISSVGIACNNKKKQASQNSSFAAGAGEERKNNRCLSAQERANICREIDNIDWLCGFLKY